MTTDAHTPPAPPASVRSYTIGFVLAIALTLLAFWAAANAGSIAVFVIIGLALLQLLVQLVFFLHLGRGNGSGWNLGMFLFTITIIGILVGGTLWIMYNLAHLHMPAPSMNDLYDQGIVSPQTETH